MKTSSVTIISNFFMPQLNRFRTIRVYLPPAYESNNRHYGVMYMQDGQNLFDTKDSAFGTIWDIQSTMDKRHHESPEMDIIIVGIDNGEQYRYAEYSPWHSDIGAYYLPHAKATGFPGGEGFLYMQFLVQTLKPFIDDHFRTKPDRMHTAIAGSSMGGLISLCTGLKYSSVFSKIAAFSSAFYFAESEVITWIQKTEKADQMRIYLDVGTQETSNHLIPEFREIYIKCSKNVFESLTLKGYDSKSLDFKVFDGDIHNESCWAKRFPAMLDWLYE